MSYSLNELLNASDALMAPVRLGMVKPTSMVSRSLSANADVLEVMERYLNTEQDLTTLLTASEELQGGKAAKRRRSGSRRDTDVSDSEAMDVDRPRRGAFIDSDESESDSDGDGERSTRRLNSQGSVAGVADEVLPTATRGSRASGYERARNAAAFAVDDSTDSLR